MSNSRRMPVIGFWLFIAGVFVGTAWLGASGFLLSAHGWWLGVTFALTAGGIGFSLFFRAEPRLPATGPEEPTRGTIVALEGCREQLERIATHLECLRPSLKCIAEPTEEIFVRLGHCAEQLEQLGKNLHDAAQARSSTPLPLDSLVEEEKPAPTLDLGQELITAWERYRRDGDGYFKAKGLQAELADRGIDAKIEDLEQDGHGFLLVADESSGSRGFFVVPNFTSSPRSAARWFEDHSSRRLGGRVKELRRLARGRWSNNDPEVVEKGVVA